MSILQRYLDINSISRYSISKKSGISASSLQTSVDSPRGINGISVHVIKAVAVALDKTPGAVLDELIELEKENN